MALAARVSLITLGIADLARARRFYAALGWREAEESSEAIAFFQLHGQVLALYSRVALASEMGRGDLPEGSGSVTLAQNLGSDAEVDALHNAMVAAGATSLRAPSRTSYGGYVGYVADPDGHVWELAHVDAFPLAADGTLTLPSMAS